MRGGGRRGYAYKYASTATTSSKSASYGDNDVETLLCQPGLSKYHV